jgi:hypothetical protein
MGTPSAPARAWGNRGKNRDRMEWSEDAAYELQA